MQGGKPAGQAGGMKGVALLQIPMGSYWTPRIPFRAVQAPGHAMSNYGSATFFLPSGSTARSNHLLLHDLEVQIKYIIIPLLPRG